jgi:PIN domain nuclease of toxin-antitoxin system
LNDPDRLPQQLRAELDNQTEIPFFSVINIWEIAIKSVKHKSFRVNPNDIRQTLLRDGWREMDFKGEHAAAVSKLPLIHGDPFDRAMIAQALVEKRQLVTADSILANYGPMVRLI